MLQLIVALLVSGSPADVTSLSLLDGRLIADFPRSAKIVSRSPEGIMGAPRSQATETRVIVDRGAERLVVLCEELMRTAGADFEQQVRAGASAGKDPYGTLKVLPRSRPDVIRLTPATLDPNGEAILLERVLFTNRDGTIQKLQFFVNPAGFKNADHWRQVVDTIRESLRAGTRQLERSKRTARLAGAGLSIDVPSQHVLSLRRAADFQLYDLEQITPYGAAVGDMMIYVGDHPEKVQPRSTTVAGTLFGKNVTWSQDKSGEKDGRFFQEVLVSIPGGNGLRSRHDLCGLTGRTEAPAARGRDPANRKGR